MSKSTSGSLSSPWLWNGPVSFSEIGPSSWDAAAPVASSLALRSRLTLPLSTFFFPLKVWLMSCWALSSVPPPRRRRTRPARAPARRGRARAAGGDGFGGELARRTFLSTAAASRLRACSRACDRRLRGKRGSTYKTPCSRCAGLRHITQQPLRGAHRRRRRGSRRMRCRAARGRRGRTQARSRVAPRSTARWRAARSMRSSVPGYLASYSARAAHAQGAVGTAAGRARLRARHIALVRAPEAPHRAAAAHVPDPGPQPRVVGEGGAAGLRRATDVRRPAA